MTFKPKLAHGQTGWSTGRVSSCLPASTHGDRTIKVFFDITARMLVLHIPGINKHHTYELGLWVCLDQKEQVLWGMFQKHELKALEEDTWISEALQKPVVNSFLNMTCWMTVLPSNRYNREILSILNFSKVNSTWVSEFFCFLPGSSAFVSLSRAKAEGSNWNFKICHLSLCKSCLVRQSLFIYTQTTIPASYSSNITKKKNKPNKQTNKTKTKK